MRSRVPQRSLDAVMSARLAHPARSIGDGGIIETTGAAQKQDLALDLGVVLVVLSDPGERGDFGLIVKTADRYRPMLTGILDQELGTFLHLGLGGPGTFWGASLVNRSRGHRAGSGSRFRRAFAALGRTVSALPRGGP